MPDSHCRRRSQAAAAELEAQKTLRFSAEQAALHLHASLSEVTTALQASEVRVCHM